VRQFGYPLQFNEDARSAKYYNRWYV